MANIEKIVLPDNTEYDVKDAKALPKTAGSTEQLTGDLYIDCSDSTNKNIYFANNGSKIAKIQKQGSTGAFIIASVDSNDTSRVGLDCTESDNLIIFTDGGSGIYLRPNGLNSTIGQFVVNSNGEITVNGQIYGGVTETTKSSTSSVACTGTTWATAVSVTGLSSTGYYVAVGQLTYNPNSSSAHTPRCRLITAGGTELAQQCVYMASNTSVPFNVFGMMHGSTGFTLQCSPQASAITNGTISSGAKLAIFRVG